MLFSFLSLKFKMQSLKLWDQPLADSCFYQNLSGRKLYPLISLDSVFSREEQGGGFLSLKVQRATLIIAGQWSRSQEAVQKGLTVVCGWFILFGLNS